MTNDALNLTTLPPEIIFIIAESDEDSLDGMRLISRSWNNSILAYLTDSRYKPVLERVYFDMTIESDFPGNDDNAPDPDNHFTMWAIVPERRAGARIGAGKWLNVHQAFPEAVEVVCAPQKILSDEELKEDQVKQNSLAPLAFLSLGISIGAFACARRYFASLACALLAVPTFFHRPVKPETEGNLPINRLNRFFSSFSSIDLLVLEASPSKKEMKEVVMTLGNLRIRRLHINCFHSSDLDREIILHLVRHHRIENVTMQSEYLRKTNLFDFASEILKMNATLDIYENGSTEKEIELYFLRDRSYWERKATEFVLQGVSLQISCEEDADFDDRLLHDGIQIHLKFRLIGQRGNDNEDTVVVNIPRGFKRFE